MKNINKYLQEADEYIKNKNYNDAFSLCSNIMNIDPNNTEAIFKAGYCCYKLKKYDISMMYFVRASLLEKLDINRAVYKYYIGRCYYYFDAFEEALEYFKEAYNLDNKNKHYTLWIGITYSKKASDNNTYNNALIYLSMSLGSKDYLVYGYIGYCHIKLGNYDKAIMYLEKSVNLKYDDYLSRYYLGNTYFLIQAYDKALEHLNESVKLKNDCFDSWFDLGILYQVIDEDILSYECFEAARNIALNYDDIEKKLNCFIKLTDSQNREYLNSLYLGICYVKLESYENASYHLLESIKINNKYNSNENNYSAYYWIGYINYVNGEYQDALKYLKKSIILNDNDYENNYSAYYWIGYINYVNGEYQDALKYLKKSIILNDNDYEENYLILLCIGECYFKLGNHKKALFNFKKSLKLKDDEAETYKIIAELYMKMGKKDKYCSYINKHKKLLKKTEKKDIDNYIKRINRDYKSYFYNDYLKGNTILDNEVLKQKIFYNKVDIKNIYNNALGFCDEYGVLDESYYNSKKTDIARFINFLFQDIENNDLYNLYSSNAEKKNYIDFKSFNIYNFMSYQNDH